MGYLSNKINSKPEFDKKSVDLARKFTDAQSKDLAKIYRELNTNNSINDILEKGKKLSKEQCRDGSKCYR